MDFLTKHKADIESLIGQVQHITNVNTFDEAIDHLNEIKQYKTTVNNVADITQKLANVDRTKVKQTKDVDKEVFNETYPMSLNEMQNQPEFKNYIDYMNDTKANNKEPLTLDKFLEERPQDKARVQALHPNLYKTEKEQQPLNKEEQLAEYYQTAGVTPEQYKWYLDNKDKYTTTKANEQITDLMNQYIPYFVERGAKDLGVLLGTQGANMMYQPPETKYEKVGEDLYEIKKDLQTGATTVKKAVTGDTKWNPDAQIPISMYEKDGKYYATQTERDPHGNTRTIDTPVDASVYNTWVRDEIVKQQKLSDVDKQNLKFGNTIINIPGLGNTDLPGGKNSKKGRVGTGSLTSGEKKDATLFETLHDLQRDKITGVTHPVSKDDQTDQTDKLINDEVKRLSYEYGLPESELLKYSDQLRDGSKKEQSAIMNKLAGHIPEQTAINAAQRIKDWIGVLQNTYANDKNSYDGMKQGFWKEIDQYYYQGLISREMYQELKKSYY